MITLLRFVLMHLLVTHASFLLTWGFPADLGAEDFAAIVESAWSKPSMQPYADIIVSDSVIYVFSEEKHAFKYISISELPDDEIKLINDVIDVFNFLNSQVHGVDASDQSSEVTWSMVSAKGTNISVLAKFSPGQGGDVVNGISKVVDISKKSKMPDCIIAVNALANGSLIKTISSLPTSKLCSIDAMMRRFPWAKPFLPAEENATKAKVD
jgi:hypothetical protein